jgi:hypothetical protein
MLFLETDSKVVDSLLFTLLSVIRASSPKDHTSRTILLPNSLTTSPSSASHSSSQFRPHTISFLTALDQPLFLTDCFPSSLDVSCTFTLYNPSTFSANGLFLSTNSLSFLFLQTEPFSFPPFLPRFFNFFPSLCWVLSVIVALTLCRRKCFPSCWHGSHSCLPERSRETSPVLTHQWHRR